LAEKVPRLRPNAQEARRRLASPPVLLVLPGSRTGEIRRLLGVFSAAVSRIRNRLSALEVVIPTVPPLVEMIRQASAQWTQPPRIIMEPAEKEAAFRIARAALTKSGTVTLELALAGVPMVAAYKVSALEYLAVGRAIEKRLSSIILVNLFLGENVIPELLQHRCTPDELADAMIPLFDDTPQRRRQVEAFGRLDAVIRTGSSLPAARAAEAVLELLKRG
jgi:lipid-A-disaccharide synthase